MISEILLALVASLFTASASVAQRVAAAPAPGELSFSWRLVTFLIRRPVWFVGILCMIAGFVFQMAALHVGDLALVQPVIATELLFVFAYLAIRNHHLVHARDWTAAAGMALGLGAFLVVASPQGGSDHASAENWMLAGIATFVAAVIAGLLAYVRVHRDRPSTPARRAAMLSVSSGIVWGFVAAVIKELTTHIGAGPVGIFTNWSPYVLLVTGAAAMFIATNAFQAGPLAASQPGLTIMDPLVASLLGVVLFHEQISHTRLDLAGEAVALLVVCASVVLLSRSRLIQDPTLDPDSVGPPPPTRPPLGGRRTESGNGERPLAEHERAPANRLTAWGRAARASP